MKHSVKSIIVVYCVMATIFLLKVHAQVPGYFFKNISEVDGFRLIDIKCLAQDQQGFMWIGSIHGLYRYDGHQARIYQHIHGDTNTLSDSRITALMEDPEGYIWVGTQNGLNRIEPVNWTVTQIFPEESSVVSPLNWGIVHALLSSNKNGLWVGTDLGALIHYSPTDGSVQQFNPDPEQTNVPLTSIYHIVRDRTQSHILWLATNAGLLSFDTRTQKFKCFWPPQPEKTVYAFNDGAFAHQVIYRIFQDEEDLLWVGARETGVVYLFDQKLAKWENVHQMRSVVHDLQQGPDGNLWVVDQKNGIARINLKDRSVHYLTEQPNKKNWLASNLVNTLYKDRAGRFWIGQMEHISIIDPANQHFNFLSLPHDTTFITAIYEFRPGLWCAAGLFTNGFYWIEGGKTEFVDLSSVLPPTSSPLKIYQFWAEGDSMLWMAAREGLFTYHIPSRKVANHLASLPYPAKSSQLNVFHAIIQDQNGNFWAGGKNGLIRFRPQTQELTQFPLLKKDNTPRRVWRLLEDKNGRIFITTDEGVFVYDPSKQSILPLHYWFKDLQYLQNTSFMGLTQTPQGAIWVSSQNDLLIKLEMKDIGGNHYTLHQIGIDPFMPRLRDLVWENNGLSPSGYLWTANQFGLLRIDGVTFEKKHYIEKDGFTVHSTFGEPALYLTSNRLLMVGKAGGIEILDLKNLQNNLEVYAPIITSITVTDTRGEQFVFEAELRDCLLNQKTLELPSEPALIKIDFVSPAFTHPERQQYTFYLEGLENRFRSPSAERSVFYTYLDKGEYTFWVKALNSDGLITSPTVQLSLAVAPAYYETHFAYFVYLILFGAGIWGLVYYIKREAKKSEIMHLQDVEVKHLQHMAQERAQMFSKVTHELKTPLTVILSTVRNLLQHHEALSLKEDVLMIKKQAEKQLEQVNQMLQTHANELGVIQVRPSIRPLGQEISSIAQEFQPIAEEKDITLQVALPYIEFFVKTDWHMIATILQNLLGNAIKFTPAGGKVQLDVFNEKSKKGGQNNENEGVVHLLQLQVQDNGIGIPTEYHEQIFDPFFRVGMPVDQLMPEGAGIGLKTTKDYVSKLNGRIWVESEPKKGATFICEIPVEVMGNMQLDTLILPPQPTPAYPVPLVVEAAPSVRKSSSKIKKHVVLIVDDQPEIRHVLKKSLETDYALLFAENGQQALEQLAEKQPDVIITDLMMPVMDGEQLVNTLRNNDQLSHIPVIVLTAKNAPGLDLTQMENGSDYILFKPIDHDRLNLILNNIVQRQSKLIKKAYQSMKPALQENEEQQPSADLKELALQMIERNYHQQGYNVDDLAKDLNMTRVTFYRKYKKSYPNDPLPADLLRDFRLQKAMKLLVTKKYSVAEACYQVGFEDSTNFSKSFHKKFGLYPSQVLGSDS